MLANAPEPNALHDGRVPAVRRCVLPAPVDQPPVKHEAIPLVQRHVHKVTLDGVVKGLVQDFQVYVFNLLRERNNFGRAISDIHGIRGHQRLDGIERQHVVDLVLCVQLADTFWACFPKLSASDVNRVINVAQLSVAFAFNPMRCEGAHRAETKQRVHNGVVDGVVDQLHQQIRILLSHGLQQVIYQVLARLRNAK